MGLGIWRYYVRRYIRTPLVRAGESLLCGVGLHAWDKKRTYCVRFWCHLFPRIERVCSEPELGCEHDIQPVNEHWGRCVKCEEDDFPISDLAAYGAADCVMCQDTRSVAVFVEDRPNALASGLCPKCRGHQWGQPDDDGVRTCAHPECGVSIQDDEDGTGWHANPKDEGKLGYGWIATTVKPIPPCHGGRAPQKKFMLWG
jgi:hypothetical protein